MKGAMPLVLACACAAQGHWPPRPAERPATRRELAAYELTVQAPSPVERAAFAKALVAQGFDVVEHPPYRLQLEVTLTHEGLSLVATLRSDGFFVDEAVGDDLETLARTLAVSERVKDFIHNSGVPQQWYIPEGRRPLLGNGSTEERASVRSAPRRSRSSHARVRGRGVKAAWNQPQPATYPPEEVHMPKKMLRIDRRAFLKLGVGAVGSVALAPRIALSAESDEEQKLYAAAKQEGKVVWWTSHYQLSAAEAVRDAFVAKYPGVQVEFIRQTAQVVYQRLSQNLKAGVKELDVFASTDESHYLKLKSQGVLAAHKPLGVDHLPKAFQGIDPDNTYHLGALALVVVNHHPSVTAPPQKWTDLHDPKWQGQITLGHPGFSGYVGNWVVAMWDKHGWEYFTRLAKNKPKIGRSIFDTVTDIVGGERKVGAGPENQSLESKAKGNPIDIKFPSDDAVIVISPVGILKDAPHPNAARLFESFFYSKEYSQAMAKTFNYPLRSDVPAPAGVSIDRVKYYRNKAERLDKGIPEAIEKWRETFGV